MAVDVERARADARRRVEQFERDRRAVFAICNAFGLNRGDRIEIASVMLNANVGSYSELTPDDMRRLRDALEGAVLVCKIQMERRRGERV